ncbi:unnamed protein product [Brassicogethes aeneus]|uniref:Uncharacterized protein n=1 Tax=Brassicogethes aeneus TaxID=1431903 RepID=A0A9P0FHS9_BRAAE|nr:unnamed protein product [Brassicogethes aeneus]
MSFLVKLSQKHLKIYSNPSKFISQRRKFSCEDQFAKCKVVLINGGGGVTGQAFASLFLKSGAKAVVIADCERNECICQLMEKYGGDRLVFEKVDAASKASLEGVFKSTVRNHGHLDFVVNNARFMSIDNWQKTICINNFGLVLGTFFGLKYMGLQKCKGVGGTIVNVSNLAALEPFFPVPVYTGAGHFLLQFTRGMGNNFFYKKSNVRIMGLITASIHPTELSGALPKDSCFGDLGNLSEEMAKMVYNLPTHDCRTFELFMDHVIKEGQTGDIWVAEGIDVFKIRAYDRNKLKCKAAA